MTNDQVQLARKWAEEWTRNWDERDDPAVYAAAKIVLANTTQPTMADVEWNREKHVLAGATFDTDDGQVDVVMLAKDVSLIDYATLDGQFGYEHLSYFTPNGKRYELREVRAGAPDVKRARELLEESVRDDNSQTLAEGKLVLAIYDALNALEDTEPDHPTTLTTVEDYENAPVGTVVEGKGKLPWTRLEYVWKETAGTKASDAYMAGAPRRVLRWGWGE